MKGLLFSEPMVRAWMDGRKTVTRRLIGGIDPSFFIRERQSEESLYLFSKLPPGVPYESKWINPPYRPGETVYIKETWHLCGADTQDGKPHTEVIYKANGAICSFCGDAVKWKSPRFMPEWASRIHAKIISVRPERVQAITEEEAFKEGIFVNQHGVIHWRDDSGIGFDRGITAYFKLWDTLHPGSWGRNDWCWVYTLKKLYK
jgi:hypothetical protein